jgi:Caspase domain
MAGRYRALLIGNSTYPAGEHNLQALKGPVKDIAAVNRALIDPGAGLFADVEVTLLPEATSTRAIRALSRFFGRADREDVLHDAADGRVLGFQTAKPGQDTVTLAPGESRSVYLGLSDCAVQVSAG